MNAVMEPEAEMKAPLVQTETDGNAAPGEPSPAPAETAQPDSQLSGRQYSLLQRAFDFFNVRLFAGELPQVLLTLHRHKKAAGYFWADQFTLARPADKKNGLFEARSVHEIALNPECFLESVPSERTLSTLGHEMAHLWQEEFGKKKPRKCYHNKEWASKMEEIGLMPSTTGAKGGKKTGQSCSHYIIPDGPFAVACKRFLEQVGSAILVTSPPKLKLVSLKEKKKLKARFECPVCGMKAWAKPTAKLTCGECNKPMLSDSPDVQ